jgi:hypothetical protein
VDIDDFFKTYCIKKLNTNDLQYYKLLTIPRRLPIFNTFDQYLNYTSSHLPMIDNQIVLYGDILYQGVKKNVFLSNLSYYQIPHIIVGYFNNINDYQKQDGVLIFLNDVNLLSWMMNRYHTKHYLQILKELYTPQYPYPYLFTDIHGNIFIVQNVKNGTYEEAVFVSYYWHTNHINLGYHVKPTQTIQCHASIYKTLLVNQFDKNLSHIEIIHQGSNTCQILDYQYKDVVDKKKTSYAALLTLF